MESVHIERQIIEFAFVVSYWTIGIAIEWYQGIYKIPYCFATSMENMSTIFVHMDAFHILALDITTQRRAFVNNQAAFACLLGKVGKSSSK